jgi:glycosyltransferase involved in cell wall biosynthesis
MRCRYPLRRSIVAQFPEEYLSNSRLKISPEIQACDVLIVGRIRKYKGLHLLTDLVKSFNESMNIDFLLAGSGKIVIREVENLQIVRRWLTESEFEGIFLKARITLLLHEEASQSGIPSVATANGKWIVAPKLGGIAEQIEDGINGYLYEVDNLHSLKEAILRALRKEELGELPVRENSEPISMSLSKFLEQGNKLH